MNKIITLIFFSLCYLTCLAFIEREKKYHINLRSANEIQSARYFEDNIIQPVRILKGNVLLDDSEMRIFCDEAIQYSLSKKIKMLRNVRILIDSLTIRTRNGGTYFNEEQLLTLDDKVELLDDSVQITGDKLFYHRKKKLSLLVGNVIMKQRKSTTFCDSLIYVKHRHIVKIRHNIFLTQDNNNTTILADSLTHHLQKNENTFYGVGRNQVKFQKIEKTNKPFSHDTLFILSKRLSSFEKPKTDSLDKLIMNDSVNIIMNDLLCYAMRATYLPNQKLIILTGNPVIWKKNVQASGDSIVIYLAPRNLKFSIENIYLHGNAFISVKDTLDKKKQRFNQSSGKMAKLYFSDSSELHRADISNQAKLVYHLYKGKTGRGAAKLTGDTIKFHFSHSDFSGFDIIGGIQGEQIPEKMVRQSPIRLEGFKDRQNSKPVTPKAELFQNKKVNKTR